ncbi:MAG: CRTAC1 family protein, partial [Planctomycetota bacterium]|nr:CRTAC1 family protein [Planctomycetota bacterium]
YVANYLLYDSRVHKACSSSRKQTPSYCHPNKYDGAPDSLYLNRGGGRFEDISRAAGIAVRGRILSKGLGVLPTDFDSDGDIDFLVANDSVPNFLWRNLGGGKFEDAALEAGVALNTTGSPEACMGVDGGDVNGDGLQDYFLTNFSEETDTLFFGEGDGFFDDNTLRSGLGKPTFDPLGFGTRLFDYDLDGDLDIYVTRGHILDNLETLHPGTRLRYAQPDHLFQNDGKGRFTDVSESSGSWFKKKLVGRAVATVDYDSDGDLDLFIVNSGQECALLENRAERKGSWIGIRLQGTPPCSRDATGSLITLKTGAGVRRVEVRSTQSYMAAGDSRVTLSLDKGATKAPPVEVRWSDGLRERFNNLQAERYHLLVRGKGEILGG